jgi:lipopolysaccharide transport system ATP-binding protein
MTDRIISVANLGKQYAVGQHSSRTDLRETLTNFVTAKHRTTSSNSIVKPRSSSLMWALRHISFEVRKGEVLGIVGGNGSGKTTLLRILGRISQPSEGLVEIRGRVAVLLDAVAGFHSELTGRDNIFLLASILGMPRAQYERNFDSIVAFAELEKFLETPLKYYSSGMCVRLAFAVATHMDSCVFLVDEVLAVADREYQMKSLEKMAALARGNRSVLLVSHDLWLMQQLCSRVLVLADGQVEHFGPTREALDYYRSRWGSACEPRTSEEVSS